MRGGTDRHDHESTAGGGLQSCADYQGLICERWELVRRRGGERNQDGGKLILKHLLHHPNLLILDEPYSGFDWDTYQRFWRYVGQLRAEGCAILVVSHFITEKELFDRIYEMKNGTLQ